MKRLKFYCQIFILFCKKNPLISGIYLATVSIGLFSLLYSYQSQMQTINQYREHRDVRALSFKVPQMSPELWGYLEGHQDLETVILVHEDLSEPENLQEPYISSIVAHYNRVEDESDKTIGEFSSPNALEIILGRDMYDYLKVNNQLEEPFVIAGSSFKIVGYYQTSLLPQVEIPYETFKQRVLPTEIVVYVKAEQIVRLKSIEKEIQERFGNDPEGLMEVIDQRRVESMEMLVIMSGVVVFVNALFLYTFLLVQRDKEFSVYRLHGLSKKQTWNYLVLETVFIYGMSFILASAIYFMLAGILNLGTLMNGIVFLFFVPLGILLALVTCLFLVIEFRDKDRVVRL